MKKIEQEILLGAHKNHELERRAPAHWRVGIRGHITQNPISLESMEEPKIINGIHEANWMRFSDTNSIENLTALDAKNKLEGFLRSHHIEGVEWGRTSNIRPEILLKIGYAFVLSNRFYEKLKADALMQDWQGRGLDCFILPELPEGADLYASEALGLTKFADQVKTDHLITRGHIGRIPGSVESVLAGQKEAKKTVDTAFESLEKQGLAVRVRGYNLCFTWDGITLTRAGVAMAEKIEEDLYQEHLAQEAAKAPKQCKIKCISCGEVLLHTNNRFRPDKATTGDMIEFLPHLAQAGYSIQFGPNDCGDAIQCPACGEGLVDGSSFRFKEGVLIEDTENINEPEGIETDQPGTGKKKIDDNELLKMIDEEGKNQVEVANFFGVTKQAISKKLKALRGN